MPKELNALVRDRTRYKGDLSKTIVHCVANTVPLHEPVLVTETAMQIMLDDDLHNRLHTVATTRNTSVNRLINSAVASCLHVKSPVDLALEGNRNFVVVAVGNVCDAGNFGVFQGLALPAHHFYGWLLF